MKGERRRGSVPLSLFMCAQEILHINLFEFRVEILESSVLDGILFLFVQKKRGDLAKIIIKISSSYILNTNCDFFSTLNLFVQQHHV